jgi:hypothetical protein
MVLTRRVQLHHGGTRQSKLAAAPPSRQPRSQRQKGSERRALFVAQNGALYSLSYGPTAS